MEEKKRSSAKSATTAALRRAKASPDRYLRVGDVKGVAPATAAKALSRLVAKGDLVRAAKGLYYMPRETLLGKSRPSEAQAFREKLSKYGRPTGTSAANLLGLSTQVAARQEVAVYASAKPRGVGSTRVTLRKHSKLAPLDETLSAVLETLRDRGKHSELSPEETVSRLHGAVQAEGASPRRLRRLVEGALDEPPRVRALLGALLQSWGLSEAVWRPLRRSLNPLSRFNFGLFSVLSNAREWQAK